VVIEIAVTYNTHQQAFFPIDPGEGWRVDPASRTLVVGHGVPRIHVPLDNVMFFTLVEKPDHDDQLSAEELSMLLDRTMGKPPLCGGCGRPVGMQMAPEIPTERRAKQ
jgi:hypothetical protein